MKMTLENVTEKKNISKTHKTAHNNWESKVAFTHTLIKYWIYTFFKENL